MIKFKYIAVVLMLLLVVACNMSKNAEKYDHFDQEKFRPYNDDLLKIIPANKISKGSTSFKRNLFSIEAATFNFENPEIVYTNDSIINSKADSAFEVLRKMPSLSNNFEGIQISLEYIDTLESNLIERKVYTFKYNMRD